MCVLRMTSSFFSRGDVELARVIMESLEEFKLTSGLVPILPKSMTYFCNVVTHIKNAILNIMPFSEGELPVKYLGVHLISSRLLIRDCKVLVEKAKNRIGIIDDIHQLIRGFLWCNGESIRRKAKVSWDEICLLKKEGGLGLRHLDIFNYALMTTHIWKIVSSKKSLWVRWIHTYKLRGRSFWDVPVKSDMSWGWPWLHKAPDIGTIAAPVLDVLQTDVTQWSDHNGTLSSFSVTKAWEAIRPRDNQCAFSAKVWSYVCVLADMDLVPPVMHDIILHLQPMGSKRTARSPEEIRDILMVTVRLKLLSLRFKNTDSVRHLLSRWKMPKNFRIYG
ncbi:hypothetical protein Tco_1412098 [Tanacetum coccineum]